MSLSAAQVMKAIRRIARAIDVRSKRIGRETGLTIPQIVVLQAIADLGAVTTGRLSTHADMSAATTVTILDKLEGRGLVTRQRSAADRRIVHAALTAEGAAVLAQAPPLFSEDFTRAFGELPEAERREIVAAFEAVADLLEPGRLGAEERLDLPLPP